MNVQDIINQIAASDNVAAKESIEDVLSAKAFDALQSRKQEMATTLFGGQEQEPEEATEDEEEIVYEEELEEEAKSSERDRDFHDRVNQTLKHGTFRNVPGYQHRDNSRDRESDMNHHGWIHHDKDGDKPYSVSAHRDDKGNTKLHIHPHIDASNEYSPNRGHPSGSGDRIHKEWHNKAKKIAKNINDNTPHKAKVVTRKAEKFNPHTDKFEMGKDLPHVEVSMAKHKQEPEKSSSSSSSSGSGHRYDPKSEFLSRPGEVARQTRVARSAFSSSYGGDASNYRR